MEISNESKLFFKETIIYHIFECLWISDLFSPIITTIISLFIYDYLRSKKIKNKLEFIRATLLDPYLTSDQIIFCCPPIIFFENQSDMPIFYEIFMKFL